MPLETGKVLNNRYRVVKLLGQGGFGAVYRAWDMNLNGPCAVKENFDTSKEAQSQFAREASILYNLRHPNLPHVTDHFTIEDQGQYLVMEFIEGEDLQEKIDHAGGPLPEEQVLPWILQVCDALTYLHSRTPPIVHRDLKPANVRITPEGLAVLVDFGIAKIYDPALRTTQGARAVTPGYSPFEQYGQKPTDARTDVYSLGATLYAALTGKAPPESIERVGVADPTAGLPSPRSLNPAISPQVEAAILKAMQMLPDQRFQSMADFKAALSAAPTATPVAPVRVTVAMQPATPASKDVEPILVARPLVEPHPSARPERKRSRKALLAGLAILAGIVVVSALIYFVSVARQLKAPPQVAYTSQPATLPPASEVHPTQPLPATSPPGPTPAQEVPPPAFECRDPLGCVTFGPDEPIHIAYALVVAGPNEALGIDSRNGIEIAMADRGPVLGHAIRLTGEDTGCTPEGGETAAARLSADPTIVAVIGTSCSSEARVAMPLLSRAGFVVVSPSNTAPDLTDPGNPNNHPGYFRTAHNDIVQGAAAARFVWKKLGVRKAATIHDGSIYAERLQQVFADEFRSLGGQITDQEAFDPNQTDMGPLLTRIAAESPELVYFPVFLPAGGFIIRQSREIPGLRRVHLMGADGLFSPDVVEVAGGALEGFYVSSPFVSGPDYDAFIARYKEAFGRDPLSIFHAHAYDAAMLVFAAIEKVAVVEPDGTLHIPRSAMREIMYATRGFHGLTGALTCSPTGDCADPLIAVYQYHAGRFPPEKIWP